MATRCSGVELYDRKEDDFLKSGFEILGAGAISCYTTGRINKKILFSTCREQGLFERDPILQLQRYVFFSKYCLHYIFLFILCYFNQL